MPLEFGFQPESLVVELAYGGGFNQALMSLSGGWPVGSTIALHFTDAPSDLASGITWMATISGVTATFLASQAQVAAVIAAQFWVARLIYTDGSGNVTVWATGAARAL